MIKFLSHEEVESSEVIHEVWKKHLNNNLENPNLLYQSPEWFEHINKFKKSNRLFLGVYLTKNGNVAGLAPISLNYYPLLFDVFAFRILEKKMRSVLILGNYPLFPNDFHYHESFIEEIKNKFSDYNSIYFDSIGQDNFFWQFLKESEYVRTHYIPYQVGGVRTHYLIRLPESFDDYLAGLGRKTRYWYRKGLRILERDFKKNYDLKCITEEENIPFLLESIEEVVQNSWQLKKLGKRIHNNQWHVSKYKDLANRNILRSYLLFFENKPVAFLLGFKYCGTYIAEETGYDQNFSTYFPGKLMLFMIIRDLIENTKCKIVNLGIGEGFHKEKISNVKNIDASVILMRRSLPNHLLHLSHLGFTKTINLSKSILANLKKQ